MKHAYTIFDAKGAFYLTPFFSHNESMAMREMASLLMDDSHPITQHAGDYTLYYLGDFDEDTGVLVAKEPVAVINLMMLKNEIVHTEMPERAETRIQ